MSICKNYCLSSLWYAAFAVFWQASCIMYPAASYNTDIDFPILSLCVFFYRSGKKRRPAPLRRMEIHQPADAEARNGVVQRCVREGRHLQGEIMGWTFFFSSFFNRVYSPARIVGSFTPTDLVDEVVPGSQEGVFSSPPDIVGMRGSIPCGHTTTAMHHTSTSHGISLHFCREGRVLR